MSLEVHCVASGSSGNCILIRNGYKAVLIDAGIGIRKLAPILRSLGVDGEDLLGILITHEHNDHVAGAVRLAQRYGVPIIANAETLSAIEGVEQVPHHALDVGKAITFESLIIRSFPVSHDAVRPVGYHVSNSSATVCIATDTGIITPEMREAATEADLLIVESNHDPEMLRVGPYPWYLKQRIASDVGHLSNDNAARLLRDIANTGRAITAWLAHLSKTNNSPRVAFNTVREALASVHGAPNIKVGIALRDVPSLHWVEGIAV